MATIGTGSINLFLVSKMNIQKLLFYSGKLFLVLTVDPYFILVKATAVVKLWNLAF